MSNTEHLNNLLPSVREKLDLSIEERKEFLLEEKWITYYNTPKCQDNFF